MCGPCRLKADPAASNTQMVPKLYSVLSDKEDCKH